MAIQFNCPQCGHAISVAEQLAGHRGMCPHCRAQIILPRAGPAPTTPRPLRGKQQSSLADWLSFRRMITPAIIQGLFSVFVVLSIVGMVFFAIFAIYKLLTDPPGVEKVYLTVMAVTAPLWTALSIVVVRIYAEVLIVVFRINETLTDIHEELKKTPQQ